MRKLHEKKNSTHKEEKQKNIIPSYSKTNKPKF